MIAESVIALLNTNTALAKIVGKRIYPNIVKENSLYPAMYVSSDSMEKLGCLSRANVWIGSIDLVVFAATYKEAHEAIKVIRDQFDEYTGVIGNIGLSIQRGSEPSDDFDDIKANHIKSVEFQCVAQIK